MQQNKRSLSLTWCKHLTDESKRKDFELLLRNSTTVLGRLREILLEDLQGLDQKEVNDKDFDNPNWSHKAAYRLGDRARITKVLNLLEFIS